MRMFAQRHSAPRLRDMHRRRKIGLTPAIDNVFVRGLRIVEVCLGDYALSLSDHRPFAVRLAPSPIEVRLPPVCSP